MRNGFINEAAHKASIEARRRLAQQPKLTAKQLSFRDGIPLGQIISINWNEKKPEPVVSFHQFELAFA